ncbi:hypothetical protein ACP70R_026308 [Stipagrostis hirtigluma subsp. patula]
MSEEKGRPLPKFGEWDVNNPASADGFTVIFSKARDEKKAPTKGHNVNRSADSKDSRTEKVTSYNSRTNASGRRNGFAASRPVPHNLEEARCRVMQMNTMAKLGDVL